jgi:voltage-gated potassium channel
MPRQKDLPTDRQCSPLCSAKKYVTDRAIEELLPGGSTWLRARRRTADVLFSRDREDRWTRRVDIALILLITLNVTAVILESVSQYQLLWGPYFYAFEVFSVAIFSIEYGLRLWSAVDDPWHKHHHQALKGRLRFARTTMAVIDLLAIVPFYLALFISIDLRFLRVLRLLRIFKLTRYSGAMTLLFQVVRGEARNIGAAMFVLLLMLVITASLAFIIEGGSHSEAFSSIPAAMYWAIITMTTVGYGDIVPATAMGRLLTGVIAVLSLGMVAIPTGILASGFTSALQHRREQVEDKIEDALADGSLSAEEESEIEALAERLDVSDTAMRAIMEAARRDRRTTAPCPHCGKLPHETA